MRDPQDATSLPTFGGDNPTFSTVGVWSWDAGRVLRIGPKITGPIRGWKIVPRDED